MDSFSKYQYDQLGNISSTTIGGNTTITLSSTAAGLLSGIHFPGEVADTFTYKPRNWMHQMKVHKNYSDLYWRDFEYNKRGELVEEYLPFQQSPTAQYTYDALGRLKEEHRYDIEPNINYYYYYDKVGNRRNVNQHDYFYYPNTNKLQYCDNIEYTYDANGNISSKTNEDGTTKFYYDPEGRLISVTLPDGENGYKYYYKGNQRIRQEDLGGGGTVVEGFIYSCEVKYSALTGGVLEAVFLDASNNEIKDSLLKEISGTTEDCIVGVKSRHLTNELKFRVTRFVFRVSSK